MFSYTFASADSKVFTARSREREEVESRQLKVESERQSKRARASSALSVSAFCLRLSVCAFRLHFLSALPGCAFRLHFLSALSVCTFCLRFPAVSVDSVFLSAVSFGCVFRADFSELSRVFSARALQGDHSIRRTGEIRSNVDDPQQVIADVRFILRK